MRRKSTIKGWDLKVKSWVVALLLTFSFSTFTAIAQDAVLAAGCDASANGVSLSFSVGQVVYLSHPGTNGLLAEGVQQPYKITTVAAIKAAKSIYLTVSAYPNPATDFLMLKVENFDDENMSYQVFDLPGKILQDQKITGNQTSINMGNFLPATYFVKVFLDNKAVNTFKIIKN